MKSAINIFLLLISPLALLSQAPPIQWEKSFGGSNDDVASSIIQTSDGGFITAGWAQSNNGNVTGNHGGYDSWIVKTDASGNLQWQKTYGGTANDFAQCIRQTTDGGYIVAGESQSNNGDLTLNHGGDDFWVFKLYVNGNLVW